MFHAVVDFDVKPNINQIVLFQSGCSGNWERQSEAWGFQVWERHRSSQYSNGYE